MKQTFQWRQTENKHMNIMLSIIKKEKEGPGHWLSWGFGFGGVRVTREDLWEMTFDI